MDDPAREPADPQVPAHETPDLDNGGTGIGAIDTSVLNDFVGYPLRRAQVSVFQEFARCVATKDISPVEFSVLLLVESFPGATQTAIAENLTIEPPRMVVLMNRLEAKGLASRVKSRSDRRSHGIFLTDKGDVELQELKELVAISNERCLQNFTAEERKTLIALLQKLYTP